MKKILAAIAATVLVASGSAAQSPGAAGEPDSAQGPDLLSLSLEEAVDLAVSRSFRAQRAARNSAISELRYENSRADYLPRADVSIIAEQSERSYVEPGATYDPYANRDFRGGVTSGVHMPIDVAGVIKRQVRRARTDKEISDYEIEQAALDAGFEAEINYLNALRAQERVRADERVVQQIEALLKESRSKAPGVVPFLEVELGNAQQELTNSGTGADEALDRLKQTLRMPLDAAIYLETELSVVAGTQESENLLERALTLRPDVQQAILRIRQAELARRQKGDHLRPSVTINGFFNRELVGDSPLSSTRRQVTNRGIGVNLKVPLGRYDGGTLAREKRIATLQKDQAVADAQELSERIAYDLRQAELALERAESRIANLPDEEQAYDALQRAEKQMLGAPEGQAQSLLAQVSNARNAWRAAQTAAVDATIDYNRAVFRMRRTIGERRPVQSVSKAVPLVGAGL